MKKNVILIIVMGLVAVGGTLFVFTGNKTDDSKSAMDAQYTELTACAALPIDKAREVMGSSTQSVEASPPIKDNALTVSYCSYKNAAAEENKLKTIDITVHSSLSKVELIAHKDVFENSRPTGARSVYNFGDSAYFDPSNNALNVFQANNWFVIKGSGPVAEDDMLNSLKEVAHKILGHNGMDMEHM